MRSRSETIRLIERQCRRLRRRVLEMGLEAGPHGAHFGSAYSMAEAITTLFFGVMRMDAAHPDDPGRDRFILSKGHGALAYYITLAEAGFLPEELLHTFETKDSLLPGHPCMHRAFGLEYSTGSLGHGLSLGVGARCMPNAPGGPIKPMCWWGTASAMKARSGRPLWRRASSAWIT